MHLLVDLSGLLILLWRNDTAFSYGDLVGNFVLDMDLDIISRR